MKATMHVFQPELTTRAIRTIKGKKTEVDVIKPAVYFPISEVFNKHTRDNFIGTLIGELFYYIDRGKASKVSIIRSNQPINVTIETAEYKFNSSDVSTFLGKQLATKLVVKPNNTGSKITFIETLITLMDEIGRKPSEQTLSGLLAELKVLRALEIEERKARLSAEKAAKVQHVETADLSPEKYNEVLQQIEVLSADISQDVVSADSLEVDAMRQALENE